MAAEGMVAGKVVIVTGAGGGIGRDISLMMAAEGAKVVVNDLGTSVSGEGEDTSAAEKVAEEIRAAGGEAVANTNSVSEWEAAEGIVETAISSFGRVDCVVNNAGILRDRMFHKMPPEDFQAVIGVHLMGAFNVSRAAAPYFREQESGSLIHMTSSTGLIGNPGQSNYGAAKLGIVGLSKGIALDMARFNVRSNCISPSAWSRMVNNIPTDTPERRKMVENAQKFLTPSKNAPMAVFLASDAAKDVSGQIFATRGNELILYGQTRPVRSVHRSEGWTPQSIVDHAMPALKSSFTPLDVISDVLGWEPI